MTPRTTAPDDMADAFYRLERGRLGDRLVPSTEAEATHVSIAVFRRLAAEDEHLVASGRAHARHLGQRIADLEVQLARQTHRAEQAETMVAQQQEEAVRYGVSLRRLAAKNAALIGEKRRLRDALTGKHPLPPIHYRIEIDRDGTAHASTIVTLDTFPHRDHARTALADARRHAVQCGGHLRSLRLDTAAWRAVIYIPIAE